MRICPSSRSVSALALVAGLLAPGAAQAAPNDDLVGPLVSETFSAIGASATGSYPGGGLSGASAAQAAATIAYDASRGTYTVTAGGKTQSFAAGDRDATQSSAQLDVYVHASPTVQESLTLTRGATSGRFTYQYVGGGYWQRATTAGGGQGSFDAFVYGMPTATSAVPKTGSASYAIDILGAGTTSNGAAGISGTGSFDVAFDTGKFLLSGNMTPLYNSLLHPVLLQAQGTLASDKSFHAPITVKFDPDTFRGTLDGLFFGPHAQEVGGAWSLTQYVGIGIVNAMVGTFMGRRGSGGSVSTRFNSPTTSFALGGDGYTVTQATNKGSRKSVAGFAVNYAAGTDTFAISRGSRAYSEQFYSRVTTQGSNGMYPGQAQDALLEIDEGDALSYVRGGQWLRYGTDQASNDAFVFGYQTTLVPVTGLAAYDIYLNGAYLDPTDHSGSAGLAGKGTLLADLGAGKYTFSGTAGMTTLGGGYAPLDGTFSGSGKITAAKNQLAGPITFSFDSLGTVTGRAGGHFYGPGAAEVGLAFGAVASKGSLSGTLIGAPSEATAASSRAVAAYGKATTFTSRPVYLELPGGYPGYFQAQTFENPNALTWDPAKQQYSVALDQYAGKSLPITFGPAQASAAAITTPIVNKPGVVSKDVFYWVPFGSETSATMMPRTGKATYLLAVRGDAVLYSVKREHLAVSGTGTMAANFATQQLTITTNLTGTTDGAEVVKLGKITYGGWIQGAEWGGGATLAGGRSNTVRGYFFGLDAREVGGNFIYSNLVDYAGFAREVAGTGVIVGTRK